MDPRRTMVTAQAVVDLLNQAARLDPLAVEALVNTRVPCNDMLADHPTIQVGPTNQAGVTEVGLVGILNGVFGTFENGYGCIVAIIDDDPSVPIRFEVGKPPEEEPT